MGMDWGKRTSEVDSTIGGLLRAVPLVLKNNGSRKSASGEPETDYHDPEPQPEPDPWPPGLVPKSQSCHRDSTDLPQRSHC